MGTPIPGLDYTPLYHQLGVSGGSDVLASVTPSASAVSVAFSLGDVPEYVSGVAGPDEFAYPLGHMVEVDFTLTQAGGTGAAIDYDELGRIVDGGILLSSETLGALRQETHSSGPEVHLFDGPLGLGFMRPQPARAQIAAANGAYAVHLELWVPLALGCFLRPLDFSPWNGLLRKSGRLSLTGFRSDAFASISTGSVVSAVTVRATQYYVGLPEAILHVPHNFCRYTRAAGETVSIEQVAAPKGLQTIERGPCGLAALAWLSNLKGLGGADTVEKITAVHEPQLRQSRLTRPGHKVAISRWLAGKDYGPRSGRATTIVDDAVAFGTTFTHAPTAGHMAATLLWFPHVLPSMGARTSKVRLSPSTLNLNYSFSAVPTAVHAFRTLELLRHSNDALTDMARMMGFDVDPTNQRKAPYRLASKMDGKQDPRFVDPKKRMFIPFKIVPNT